MQALWWCWLTLATAADVRLELGATRLAAGESTVFEVIVADGEAAGVPEVSAPGDLRVAYVGQSQQVTVINGRASRTVQFRFEVIALQEGTYPLGPARVLLRDGSSAATGAVRLEVGPPRKDDGGDVAVQARVALSDAEVWQGEVVVVSTEVRARVDVLGMGWVGLPEAGLLAPRDGVPAESTYNLRDEQGEVAVQEVASARIAVDAGTLTWPPAVLQIEVRDGERRRRDLFGMFNQRTRRVAVTTQPVTLEVTPLPPPPPGFSGLVGDFELSADLSRRAAKVGASVDLVLRLEGDGTVEGFQPPPPPDVDGARLYDTTPQATAAVQQGRYRARMVWKRSIVPTREGRLTLPPVDVVVFSPTRGDYVTLTAPGTTLDVTAGGAAGDAGLTRFGEDPDDAAPEQPDRIGPPVAAAAGLSLPVRRTLPLALAALALPGGIAGALELLTRWRAHRAAQRVAKETTPADLLAALPDAPQGRPGALDAALQLALRRATARGAAPQGPLADEVAAVSALLDRIRFAGAPAPADLEARVRAAVQTLEAS